MIFTCILCNLHCDDNVVYGHFFYLLSTSDVIFVIVNTPESV